MKKLIVNQYVVEDHADYKDMHFIVKQEYSNRSTPVTDKSAAAWSIV